MIYELRPGARLSGVVELAIGDVRQRPQTPRFRLRMSLAPSPDQIRSSPERIGRGVPTVVLGLDIKVLSTCFLPNRGRCCNWKKSDLVGLGAELHA